MYKKKSKAPMIITAAAVVVLIVALILFQTYFSGNKGQQETETESETVAETETETEAEKYNITLYKNSSGTIEFDAGWLVEDTDTQSVLSVEENILVSMLITPTEGKALESVDVLDYDMQTVTSVVRSVDSTEDAGGQMRLSFVMPSRDVFINFNFVSTDYAAAMDTDAETETEETSPYGLTLYGLTDEILESYNGKFDESCFLQSLGTALNIGSDYSEYKDVTEVYFKSGEETESDDADKVLHTIYFNADEDWAVLSTYYINEDAYVFSEIAAETEMETDAAAEENISIETEAETTASTADGSGTGAVAAETSASSDSPTSSGNTSSSGVSFSGASSGTSASSASGTTSTTTSFDILSISTVFLKFVGDEDAFYQAAFNYVLGKGYTGAITGTMSSYEIDPDAQTATINILMSIGGTLTGAYNKTSNTYSFSGL
ncbi:MAG: hypothetical protein LIO99_08730 [Clostridiales bacterium]|nr:hypothetical protein [Clostridiales bacterium]